MLSYVVCAALYYVEPLASIDAGVPLGTLVKINCVEAMHPLLFDIMAPEF